MRGYLLLVSAFIIGAIQTCTPVAECAPVGERSTAETFVTESESPSSSHFHRSELQRILVDAIFNFTDNFYTIKRAFQPEPGKLKICIPVTYNIICTDQPDNVNEDESCFINCTTGYNSI